MKWVLAPIFFFFFKCEKKNSGLVAWSKSHPWLLPNLTLKLLTNSFEHANSVSFALKVTFYGEYLFSCYCPHFCSTQLPICQTSLAETFVLYKAAFLFETISWFLFSAVLLVLNRKSYIYFSPLSMFIDIF